MGVWVGWGFPFLDRLWGGGDGSDLLQPWLRRELGKYTSHPPGESTLEKGATQFSWMHGEDPCKILLKRPNFLWILLKTPGLCTTSTFLEMFLFQLRPFLLYIKPVKCAPQIGLMFLFVSSCYQRPRNIFLFQDYFWLFFFWRRIFDSYFYSSVYFLDSFGNCSETVCFAFLDEIFN